MAKESMVGWLVLCGARILDFGFWLSLERWCLSSQEGFGLGGGERGQKLSVVQCSGEVRGSRVAA